MGQVSIEYLGGGVYAVFDGYMIELRANSHETPTDTIYLEPGVLLALERFINRCREYKADH